jgi:hypothetical protein
MLAASNDGHSARQRLPKAKTVKALREPRLCKYASVPHVFYCSSTFLLWSWIRKISFYIRKNGLKALFCGRKLTLVAVFYSSVPRPSLTPTRVQSHMVWPANPPIDKVSFAHTCTDRPVHTVLFCLAAAGFLLLSVSKAWPGLFRSPQSTAGYVEIPLDDLEETSAHGEILPNRGTHIVGPGLPISRLLLVASICALTVRIELFRRICQATECTVSSIEVMPSSQHSHTHTCQPSDNYTTDCFAP